MFTSHQENNSDGNIPFVNDRRVAFGWEINNQWRFIRSTLMYGRTREYVLLIDHLESTLAPYIDDMYRAKLRYYVQEIKENLKGVKKVILQNQETIEFVQFKIAEKKYRVLMDLMSRHGFLPLPIFEDEINPTANDVQADA